MNQRAKPIKDREPPQSVESVVAMLQEIFQKMGVAEATPDAVIAAPRFYDGPVLLQDTDQVNRFGARFALAARFIGYPFDEVAFLTLRQLAELYLRQSHPEPPSLPLSDAQCERTGAREAASPKASLNGGKVASLNGGKVDSLNGGKVDGAAKDFPICFVLGCPRSGTTLFRTMLNAHPTLWAPGELHLAGYETMAERARRIVPTLRYMPLPELAERVGEPVASFARSFRSWELEGRPVSQVYETLYAADPSTLIVDKTPSYADWLEDLERIGACFPNAKFVQLVRSPYDVIRSIVRMQLYKGVADSFAPGLNPYHVAEAIWVMQNANIEAFLSGIPEERKCMLRYEELVSQPERPLARVCTLLGRAYEPAMADPYAQPSSGRVALGAGDVYVNFLDRVEPRAASEAPYPLGARCRDLAARLGY